MTVVGPNGVVLIPDEKLVPIDPGLLPEIRGKLTEMNRSKDEAREAGLSLAIATAVAGASAQAYITAQNDLGTLMAKVFSVHGVDQTTVLGVDMDKGVIKVKK